MFISLGRESTVTIKSIAKTNFGLQFPTTLSAGIPGKKKDANNFHHVACRGSSNFNETIFLHLLFLMPIFQMKHVCSCYSKTKGFY